MGLDCIPLGRAKAGHEQEWTRLMEGLYAEDDESERDRERRDEISIPAYAAVGAPCVGVDKAADEYVLARKPKDSALSDAEVLEKMRGYYVLELVRSEGIASVSNGGLYEGVDLTCFRGQILDACQGVLTSDEISYAWTQMMRPEEAVAYGERLLAAAARTRAGSPLPDRPAAAPKRGFLDRLLGHPARRTPNPSDRKAAEFSVEQQMEFVTAAGRWYLYWGRLGHPIHAYF